MYFRRPPFRPSALQALALVAALSATAQHLWPACVNAQEVLAQSPNAFRFYTAQTGAFLGVESADVGGSPFRVALTGDYAHQPFVMIDAECMTVGGACSGTQLNVVGAAATAQLSGSVLVAERLRIGLNLPFALYAQGDAYQWPEGNPPTPRTIVGGTSAGLLDPRLSLQLGLLQADEGFALSVSAFATAPLARVFPVRYLGDAGLSVGGFVHAGFHTGAWTLALQAGGVYRDSQVLIRSERGPEALFGLAVRYDVVAPLQLIAEAQGATTFGTVYDNEFPIEIRGALRYRPGADLAITLGGGTQVIQGVGTPVFRGLLGVEWAPSGRRDSDGDGVEDRADACPSEAEDRDDHNDADGCPDADNDEDGIADSVDRCPDQAEDIDQNDDTDGCPDPDDDHDGVNDGYDSCPTQAEDRDGVNDDDGCPDLDNDGDHDNIEDDRDRCPGEAEDTDGWADEDGCPEVDFDNDGLPDDGDQCPDQPEDRDGTEDDDGCPEAAGDNAAPRHHRRHHR